MISKSQQLAREFRTRAIEAAMTEMGTSLIRHVMTGTVADPLSNDSIIELLESTETFKSYIRHNFDDFKVDYDAAVKADSNDPLYSENQLVEAYEKGRRDQLRRDHPEPLALDQFMRKHHAEAFESDRNVVSYRQGLCGHRKENNATRLVRFETSDEIEHYICNFCFKQWTSESVPVELTPQR